MLARLTRRPRKTARPEDAARHLREISQITPAHVSVIMLRRISRRDGNVAYLDGNCHFTHDGKVVEAVMAEVLDERRVRFYLKDARTGATLHDSVTLERSDKLSVA